MDCPWRWVSHHPWKYLRRVDVALSALVWVTRWCLLGLKSDFIISKVLSNLVDSVMIVTLQGPGEARFHCDTVGLKRTKVH